MKNFQKICAQPASHVSHSKAGFSEVSPVNPHTLHGRSSLSNVSELTVADPFNSFVSEVFRALVHGEDDEKPTFCGISISIPGLAR